MAIPMIYKQISAVLNDLNPISKEQQNKQQGFFFRGIDDIYNCIHSVFAQHKIFTMTEVLTERYEERTTKTGTAMTRVVLRVKFTIYAEDGSNISGITIGEALDSGDKAANKAMSIAHKYFLIQLFAIPTKELDDPDRESYEVISKEKELCKIYLSEINKANTIEDLRMIYRNGLLNIKTPTILKELTGACSIRKEELTINNEEIK
jgi:hypothetical protein